MRKCLLAMLILMLFILMLILMLLNLNTGYADTDADLCIIIMSLCCITLALDHISVRCLESVGNRVICNKYLTRCYRINLTYFRLTINKFCKFQKFVIVMMLVLSIKLLCCLYLYIY